MLRKIMLMCFSLLILASLCSCRSDVQKTNLETSCSTYEISQVEYVDDEIKILYPQINGLADREKEKEINELIRIDALKLLDSYENIPSKVTVDIDYDIKCKRGNLLSVQYVGVEYIEGAAYPLNKFHTTNIDIISSRKIKLTDVINIDETFVELFKKGEYIAWETELNSVVELIKKEVNSYNLIDEFINADSMGIENTAYIFSYYTEDAIGISIGVSHALGDHAEFEIKYDDLKENLRLEDIEFLNAFE